VGGTFADIVFTLATPKALTAATYWICTEQIVHGNVSFIRRWDTQSGVLLTYGDTVTSNSTNNIALEVKIRGCQP
jgi:hypothetical protein